MARYIDADALLKMLPDDLPYKASVKRVIIQAPAADVVPREEVERIKQETAREMFKEIKNKRMFVRDRVGNTRAVVMFDDIVELKKKYTEEQESE